MNAQNAKDFLPLVQALAEGKTVQRYLGYECWQDCNGPEIEFVGNADNYRIKPEPRRWWLCKSSYTNRDQLVAVEFRDYTEIPTDYIEVVEVLK